MHFFCLLFSMMILPFFFLSAHSQEREIFPLAHTYSIVAVDSATGEVGVAVQSHWFSVGSTVPWAEAGVGAVATQSFTNPAYGLRGLELMKAGKTPQEALEILTREDEGREFRQVAFIDAQGNSAAYTGPKCIPAAGHITGKFFSVQANLMLNNRVWPAMADVFRNSSASLAERMVEALEAAEKAGGDIRGKQSAALLVVRAKPTGIRWKDRLIDLRVEDHPEPVKELKRLLLIHRAYEHMNAGDLAVESGDEEKALQEYSAAEKMQPENLEMKFWHAVALANIGRVEEALPIFRQVFNKDKNWKTLTPRLIKPEILKVNEEDLDRIMSLD
ncbi:MAG: DUF1028 domain-containing protein [Calditrichaeota bacterium]|nr:DUF1028 domain-containing protein [Calditrichota bacterium]